MSDNTDALLIALNFSTIGVFFGVFLPRGILGPILVGLALFLVLFIVVFRYLPMILTTKVKDLV